MNATFTEDEKQKAIEKLTCLLGNSFILIALRKQSSLRPSSKLLLRSLATTVPCVGLFSEPLYVTLLVTIENERWTICGHVLVGVSEPSFCDQCLD